MRHLYYHLIWGFRCHNVLLQCFFFLDTWEYLAWSRIHRIHLLQKIFKWVMTDWSLAIISVQSESCLRFSCTIFTVVITTVQEAKFKDDTLTSIRCNGIQSTKHLHCQLTLACACSAENIPWILPWNRNNDRISGYLCRRMMQWCAAFHKTTRGLLSLVSAKAVKCKQ